MVRTKGNVRWRPLVGLCLVLVLVASACSESSDTGGASVSDDDPNDGGQVTVEETGGFAVDIDPLEREEIECLYRPDLLLTPPGTIGERTIVDGEAQVVAQALTANDLLERQLLSVSEDAREASVEVLLAAVDIWRIVDPEQADSLQVAAAVQRAGGGEVAATPVLAVQVAGHWDFAPGSERTGLVDVDIEAELLETASRRDLGQRSQVAVIDTGGVPGGEAMGMPLLDPAADQETLAAGDPYRWHGAFVGGVVRTANPETAALMVRLGATSATSFNRLHHGETDLGQDPSALGPFVSDELQLLHAVARVVNAEAAPSILNVSGGTYGCGNLGVTVDDPDSATGSLVAPVGQVAAAGLWLDGSDRIFVAAAGNDSEIDRAGPHFFPSALPDVIGVASVNADGTRSGFSNKGDVCAPGAGIVGFTPDGTVAWSGTSFAAPAVAGLISSLGSMPMTADADRQSCGAGDTLVLEDSKLSACKNLEAPAKVDAGSNPEIGASGVSCDRIP